MILDIFLPEKLKGYRLLAKRVAGFELTDFQVNATVSYLAQGKQVVEKAVSQPIEPGDAQSLDQRRIAAIRECANALGKFDHVRIAVPASMTVFKELVLPFINPSRIRMVIDYEVEAMLPFPLEQAVIDFVITEQSEKKKEPSSTILVVAARSADLEAIKQTFASAGVEPTQITVDLLALYDLYKQIPEYNQIEQGSALVDFDRKTTRVAFLQNGRLRLVRNIPRGLNTLTAGIIKQTEMPAEDVVNLLNRYGVTTTNDDTFDMAREKQILNIFNDIQFTLNSFSLKLNFEQDISRILFTGPGAHLNGLISLAASSLQTPCELFQAEKVFTNKKIKNKVSPRITDWRPFTYALCASLVSKDQDEFTLLRKSLEEPPVKLIERQWLTAASLALFLLSYIGVSGYMKLSALASHYKTTEMREMRKLKKLFPPDAKALKKDKTLRKLLKSAEKVVAEKEEMWAPFSAQRLRPLHIMLELTRLIDKKTFDVTLEDIEIISEDVTTRIEVTGYFRSKSGYHFQDFGQFAKTFLESKNLVLTEEIDPTLADNRGVKFTAKLKPKEV